MEFDSEHADRRTGLQLCRVVGRRQSVELQQRWRRGMSKTDWAFEDAGPGIALGINCAEQHERQLAIELPVLIRHFLADDLAPKRLHALSHSSASLQLLLAGMPR